MGYKHKLFIVDKHYNDLQAEIIDGKKYFWAEKIAMIDMCVAEPLISVFENKPADCYIYADDGNTRIVKDKYGDPLGMASLDDVIKVIEHEINEGQDKGYRRWLPALNLLKGFSPADWRNLVVLRLAY